MKRNIPAAARRLLEAAEKACACAYAPYSKYRVGAAVQAEDDRIFTGCNVENASYGLTNCAERVAMQNAVAAGARRFVMAAVVADGKELPLPCGACRQVLTEFCPLDMPVWVAGKKRLPTAVRHTLRQLLPHAFRR